MKTLEDLYKELSYSMPFGKDELELAYNLGRINTLLELVNELEGYPVNGLMRGIITQDKLDTKLVEASNG